VLDHGGDVSLRGRPGSRCSVLHRPGQCPRRQLCRELQAFDGCRSDWDAFILAVATERWVCRSDQIGELLAFLPVDISRKGIAARNRNGARRRSVKRRVP
jgi:hypothetical protein